MAGGRPTKYKKKYCREIIEFFELEPDREFGKRTFYPSGELKSVEPAARWFPTFQGFAHSLGVNVDTLHQWKSTYPEFSEAYARAKEIQEEIWLQESMTGRYNPQFAKFFGVNCLGYKDKVETETVITDYSLRFDGMAQEDGDDISG